MKFIAQHDQMDCGPACLAMVSTFYKKEISSQHLRDSYFITRDGVSLVNIKHATNKIGFKTTAAQLKIKDIENQILPCILYWNQNHFVVLQEISKN